MKTTAFRDNEKEGHDSIRANYQRVANIKQEGSGSFPGAKRRKATCSCMHGANARRVQENSVDTNHKMAILSILPYTVMALALH